MPTAAANGIEIHYDTHGDGSPLLLLHGLGCSGEDWGRQLASFTATRSVITPSLRGFGSSHKPPGPYTIEEHAADMHALLDQLGVGRCDVLGFSMGGAVALQMALDATDRIDRLVLVNTQAEFELDHWRRYLAAVVRLGLGHVRGMERMARFLSRRMFPDPHQAPLRREMMRRYADNDRRAYLAALRGLAGWSVQHRLHEIGCPTLVVGAELDYMPLQDKRRLAERLGDARLEVVRNSRHCTPFDQAEEFNRVVLEFLDDEATAYAASSANCSAASRA